MSEETAKDLAEHFGSLEKLKKASLSDLEQIRDIGSVIAQSIYNFFQDKKNLDFIDKLKRVKVKIEGREQKSIKAKSQKLKGLIFVLTGELESMSREEARQRIREPGGQVSESVSKNTNYVVVGENPGSKFEDAKRLGVKILNEKEFIQILSR